MKITAKIDYACRALLELSLHWPNTKPLRIPLIAERQGIPMKFLIQILIQLKQLGYVESTRGKEGGYLLARAPKEIQMATLIEHLGYSRCYEPQDPQREDILSATWQAVDAAVLATLKKVDFEDLANQHRLKHGAVTFDI